MENNYRLESEEQTSLTECIIVCKEMEEACVYLFFFMRFFLAQLVKIWFTGKCMCVCGCG